MNKDTALFYEFLENNEIGFLPEINGIALAYSSGNSQIYRCAAEIYENETFLRGLLIKDEKYKHLVNTKLEFVNLHCIAIAKFAEDINVEITSEIIDKAENEIDDCMTLTIELGDYTKNYLLARLGDDEKDKLDMSAITDAKIIAEFENWVKPQLTLAVITADVIETDFRTDGKGHGKFTPPLGLETACFEAVETYLGKNPYDYLADMRKSVEKE